MLGFESLVSQAPMNSADHFGFLRRLFVLLSGLVIVFSPPRSVGAQTLAAGIIGVDTSHTVRFAKVLSGPDTEPVRRGVRIVTAYPHGSRDIYAFMEAADESQRRGGTPVAIDAGVRQACAKFTRQGPLVIDCAYPGGNLIVDGIEGDTVSIRQDLRDTPRWWFYWNFRVRGAAGRTLTFRFADRSPIGVRGPALSDDDGATWRWLGREAVTESSFSYTFPRGPSNVRFAFAMPYQAADLRRFLKTRVSKHLGAKRLTKTRKHRDVELLRFGDLHGDARHRVLLTARHHACETMASYALEGVIDAALAETDDGRWLRNNVEFLAVPFMDKDGVEDGDQGKSRAPFDHNRDYSDESIYPSVRALRKLAPSWAGGKMRLGIDLHCPYISGGGDAPGSNERIYFVELPSAHQREQLEKFSRVLEKVQSGTLVYDPKHNLPFGRGWNTAEGAGVGRNSASWMASLPGVCFATTLELPYAEADGKVVTRESARAFGQDLARAIAAYLRASD